MDYYSPGAGIAEIIVFAIGGLAGYCTHWRLGRRRKRRRWLREQGWE
jgi:hypothetical protein